MNFLLIFPFFKLAVNSNPMKKVSDANVLKASFNGLYDALTPKPYLEQMALLDYSIIDEVTPFVVAAIDFLDSPDGTRVGILDVGSSYGIGAGVIKYGYGFKSISSFFRKTSPQKNNCARQTRRWLTQCSPERDVYYVGSDSSRHAIEFGIEAGLLDAGIIKNLESPNSKLDTRDRALIEGCKILVSTGAVGYLGKHTFQAILPHMRRREGGRSPLAIFTVLDIFDAGEIMEVFHVHGFDCRRLDGISLSQRDFFDEQERAEMLALLDPMSSAYLIWSQREKLCAGLFIAAPIDGFKQFHAHIAVVAAKRWD